MLIATLLRRALLIATLLVAALLRRALLIAALLVAALLRALLIAALLRLLRARLITALLRLRRAAAIIRLADLVRLIPAVRVLARRFRSRFRLRFFRRFHGGWFRLDRRFGSGLRLALFHDGRGLRLFRLFLVPSAGMRRQILIGIQHFTQPFHALALLAGFPRLLFLFQKFAFGMPHRNKQFAYRALRQRKPLQKFLCALLNSVCRFQKIILCHVCLYPRVFRSPRRFPPRTLV